MVGSLGLGASGSVITYARHNEVEREKKKKKTYLYK